MVTLIVAMVTLIVKRCYSNAHKKPLLGIVTIIMLNTNYLMFWALFVDLNQYGYEYNTFLYLKKIIDFSQNELF